MKKVDLLVENQENYYHRRRHRRENDPNAMSLCENETNHPCAP